MKSIDNQVAVVTGAGRGIGQAIAIELGRLGARVVLAARSRAQLEETARSIANAEVAVVDVRSREAVQTLLDRSDRPVDILVNAAGIGVFGPVAEFTDEAYEAVLDTNLKGIFLACRAALPSMMARKTGHIVNIASIAGKVGTANRAVYCASKFGVVGFSEALGQEVRPHGIRVSVICPGSTNTAFHAGAKSHDWMLSSQDVAHAVRTIVTQEPNSFISEIVLRPTSPPR